MVKNSFKVPLKKWRKWSSGAKSVFNKSYDFFYNNKNLMTHPKSSDIKPEHWKTIAWNAAWIAADAVDDSIHEEFITV